MQVPDTTMFCDTSSRHVFHGSSVEVKYPKVRKSRFTKDFSWGFYCTDFPAQACRWADRFKVPGVISVYKFKTDYTLKQLRFETMTDEWLDFIAACRSGNIHQYDIVEGPMADDTIYNYVQQFLNGQITRAAFWELAKFRYPTHQISFHSLRALQTLTFVEALDSSSCKLKY